MTSLLELPAIPLNSKLRPDMSLFSTLASGFNSLGSLFALECQDDKRVLVISEPAYVERVLATNHLNYQKGLGLEGVRLLMAGGSFTEENDSWRRQRALSAPIATRRTVRTVAPAIEAAAAEAIADCRSAAEAAQAVSIEAMADKMAQRALLGALFGDDAQSLFVDRADTLLTLRASHARDMSFLVAVRRLVPAIRELVTARMDGQRCASGDFLSMLAEHVANDDACHDAVVNEVLTLLVAGNETTAATLTACWTLLSRNADVATSLAAEAIAFGPSRSIEQALSAPLCGAFVSEVLRLYPPGWVLSRRAVCDDSVGSYDVPAGTDLLLSPYLVHRHPRYWPSPNDFVASRFIGWSRAAHKMAFLPFGVGPRRCVGELFARAVTHAHLLAVLPEFHLTRSQRGFDLDVGVNLRTRPRGHSQLVPRSSLPRLATRVDAS